MKVSELIEKLSGIDGSFSVSLMSYELVSDGEGCKCDDCGCDDCVIEEETECEVEACGCFDLETKVNITSCENVDSITVSDLLESLNGVGDDLTVFSQYSNITTYSCLTGADIFEDFAVVRGVDVFYDSKKIVLQINPEQDREEWKSKRENQWVS